MKRAQRSLKRSLTTAMTVGLLALGLPAFAEDGGSTFTGDLRLGYRSVDVGGDLSKYREDINLDDGARLFVFRFELQPEDNPVADLVTLDVGNLGGDPFESLHFGVRKYGKMDFQYNRTKSDYFYEDTILPHDLADVRASTGGDFHTFDFDRVRDQATFGFRFTPQAKLDVGFDRFTKRGESTTTLDIQRDEFELDKPIDESYDNLRVGFEYAWDKATLILEEQVREYENHYEIFLPGASPGENTENAAALDFFFLDQPYSYDSNQHTVRLNARPSDKLIVTAAAVLQTLDLDVTSRLESSGVGFTGNPFTNEEIGNGDIQRDSELFDVDLSYLVNDRVAVIAGGYRHHTDQDGRFLNDGELNLGSWDIETTGAEIGVEVAVSSVVTLAGGVRFESRDVEHDASDSGGPLDLEKTSTDSDGVFARLAYRPSKRFHLDASFETGTIDDPFTLTAPTDRNRFRINAEYKADSGFFAQGTVVTEQVENDDADWDFDRDQLTFRLGYRKDRLDFNAGYTKYDIEREGGAILILPILFQAESDFFDLRVRFKANDRVTFGADLRQYENDGSFALERDDLRAYLELAVTEDYLLHLGYRTVDYDEAAANFDDYDADIAEISVGYRW